MSTGTLEVVKEDDTAAEVIESTFTAKQAKALDGRIRKAANTLQVSFDKLNDLVSEAKSGNLHVALGYNSWADYLADAVQFHPESIEQRRELVSILAGEGMSNRAIGAVVGASEPTVRRDREASGESDDAPTTGLDGKKYKKREPKEPEPQDDSDDEPEYIDAEVVQDVKMDFREAADNLVCDIGGLSAAASHSDFESVRKALARKHLKDLRQAFRDLESIVQVLEAN